MSSYSLHSLMKKDIILSPNNDVILCGTYKIPIDSNDRRFKENLCVIREAFLLVGLNCLREKKKYLAKIFFFSYPFSSLCLNEKKGLSREKLRNDFSNELSILEKLQSHRGIIKLCCWGKNQLFGVIIMEKVKEDLFDIIESKDNILGTLRRVYSPRATRLKYVIFLRILEAVEYCHSKGVAHLDIKPENVVCSFSFNLEDLDKEDLDINSLDAEDLDINERDLVKDVKLIDFGCSQSFIDEDKVFDCQGTLCYNPPELFLNWNEKNRGGVSGKAVDYWSLGILFHVLLTGVWPYYSDNMIEIRKSICSGNVYIAKKYLSHLEYRLIEGVLKRNPQERLTTTQMISQLNHMIMQLDKVI